DDSASESRALGARWPRAPPGTWCRRRTSGGCRIRAFPRSTDPGTLGDLDMTSPLRSLIGTGTKLWLDSIDPDLVKSNRALGATGATSNPIIIADLLKTGRFDAQLDALIQEQLTDDEAAWQLTDQVVRSAQQVFLPVWKETKGDDGYVSF